MRIVVVTLFPHMVADAVSHGVLGRAIERGEIVVDTVNPRELATDAHGTVDDRPYGGGPGMVMKVEPLRSAVREARNLLPSSGPVYYLSAQGRPFDQCKAQTMAELDGFVLIAGRYEGVDERLIVSEVDEELSIGDYVISGGELATLVVIDAVARLVPGVLGHAESALQDSFAEGLLECPHYTRPEEVDEMRVPEVLLTGNHKEVARWRLKQSLGRTWLRRPDLLSKRTLSREEQELLEEFKAERSHDERDG